MGWFGCGLQDGDTPLDVIGWMLDLNNPFDKNDDYYDNDEKYNQVQDGKFLTEQNIITAIRRFADVYKKESAAHGYCDNRGAQSVLAIADWLLDHDMKIPESEKPIVNEIIEYELRCPWAVNDAERRDAVEEFKAKFLELEPVDYLVTITQIRRVKVRGTARSRREACFKAKEQVNLEELEWDDIKTTYE